MLQKTNGKKGGENPIVKRKTRPGYFFAGDSRPRRRCPGGLCGGRNEALPRGEAKRRPLSLRGDDPALSKKKRVFWDKKGVALAERGLAFFLWRESVLGGGALDGLVSEDDTEGGGPGAGGGRKTVRPFFRVEVLVVGGGELFTRCGTKRGSTLARGKLASVRFLGPDDNEEFLSFENRWTFRGGGVGKRVFAYPKRGATTTTEEWDIQEGEALRILKQRRGQSSRKGRDVPKEVPTSR